MEIVKCDKEDAPKIADAIINAIGMEMAARLGAERGIEGAKELFTRVAAREDSQYSFRNCVKARNDDGCDMGFMISYDGESLHKLRKAFFEEYADMFGIKVDLGKVPDETDSAELYLDTLSVYPEYRGRGMATSLIEYAKQRAKELRKPLGLLCDKGNLNARRLYEHVGFKKVGERFFAGELMDHYIYEN
ncbi:MAG: GNAT family N-acetyltransferase [Candidatus Amulumruptor caecigallinarius]|nr:GNAT family N-acetyltransferase [Candidatus Amulumruptor caecigallinarius]